MTIKNRRRIKWLIIAFWFLMIAVSISAPEKLTGNIALTTSLTDPNTESGRGQHLYEERFNLTSETATQVLIIELNNGSNIQSNEWRNFTLYLSLYLNTTYFDRNYTTIFSEPLALQAGLTDLADQMVSKDRLDGLIYMSGHLDDLDPINDVHDIRSNMQDLTDDPTSFYNFVTSNYTHNENITSLLLPKSDEIKSIQIILTGSLANFADIESTAKDAFDSSEVISVLVILVILALVFRSPLGLVIPFISMVASLLPSYLITFVLSQYNIIDINDFLPAVIAMIGIAVAIDYNLFNLTRYKEEFHKRKAYGLSIGQWTKEDKQLAQLDSADLMNKTAGSAVMYSGITVLVGFVSLLILQSDFANGLALGVSIAIILSVITSRTLTPAILGLFGQYIDWPNFITRASKKIQETQAKKEVKNIWTRWSNLVMKHSFSFLVIGIFIIFPVTLISLQTNLSFDTIQSLPPGTESRDGLEILSQKFDLGSTNPYQVLIDTGKTNGVFDSKIINATNTLADWAIHYSENMNDKVLNFSKVSSLSVITNATSKSITTYNESQIQEILDQPNYIYISAINSTIPNYNKLMFIEQRLKPFVDVSDDSSANNTLLISISSNLDQGSSEAWSLVVKIRDKVREVFEPLGVKSYVFGYASSFYDTKQSMYGNSPIMLLFAVILIFIALTILFRSLLLPVKAILTISGSILFALGSLVWVFQDGNFLWLVAGEQMDGITFFIPVFLFTIVLGLGMDYSIFIISRIREEWMKGASPRDAVGIGLSKTASVVTSAATVMIATFLVFALAPILFLKIVGIAMAIAIFIDATVSRMILLPAAMKLAGKWNWYMPKWLNKILPDIKLEH
ncbi:MAG: MMPL family transporter [Candidatus Thorarchaeota archaeon]